MTTTDPLADALDRVGGQQGNRLEAVVAVEQARAVAQVAAQVQVAQRFPRDLDRVREELNAVCDSYELARVAFYAVPNRGQGLSVHLARELAVLWGNIDYGVHELRRDDVAGASEVQAFCWDMQRNSRATRTFQVPHAQTVTKTVRGQRVQTREPIIDLTDVYRNNQNQGARAMRECVFATLPRWIQDEAERRLRETLRKGPGTPLEQQVQDALAWAARRRVTRDQLEARVGRPVARWTQEDVSMLSVVAASIERGETSPEEQFDPPSGRVTADELGADPAPAQPAEPSTTTGGPVDDPRPVTQAQVTRLILRLRDHDAETDDDQHAWLTQELGREITSRKDLTRGELARVDAVLDVLDAARGGES
jgi:hypothetical protein